MNNLYIYIFMLLISGCVLVHVILRGQKAANTAITEQFRRDYETQKLIKKQRQVIEAQRKLIAAQKQKISSQNITIHHLNLYIQKR
jgi:hypothetical protein